MIPSILHIFDTQYECWKEAKTELVGAVPAGMYSGDCAAIGEQVYTYGGTDMEGRRGAHLHRLDVESLQWIQVPTTGDGPMKKTGHKMVSYGDQLVVFGGFGYPSSPKQPKATYLTTVGNTDGRCWTNELHVFNTKEGKQRDL